MKTKIMKTKIKALRLFLLGMLMVATLVLAVNTSQAAQVYVGVGTPYPYGTPYGPSVVYLPGHWYHGYWIPGQYVEYAGAPPGPGYVWYQGGFGWGGGWNHGHWGHGYGRGGGYHRH